MLASYLTAERVEAHRLCDDSDFQEGPLVAHYGAAKTLVEKLKGSFDHDLPVP
jgi:hypothetical protein